jgi:hypothetical protein
VERSIAGVNDCVDILETRLPLVDQAKLAKESREDDYNEDEEDPRPPHQPSWQGMGGDPN